MYREPTQTIRKLDYFQILEVDPWKRTPIPAYIGPFEVPLSMYVMVETQIKWVRITSLDKDAVLWIDFILKLILVEEISVPKYE